MGNEITHVRITDLGRFRSLFEEGRADPEDASFTGSLVSRFCSPARSRNPIDPAWRPLAKFVEEMVQPDSAEATWLLDLDRRFDRLAWSMRRTVTGEETEQLVATSVFGHAEFVLKTPSGEQVAKGSQGFTQRASTNEPCRAVAEFLESLPTEVVQDAADLTAMADDGVYKAHSSYDAADVKSQVASDLNALRTFYRSVANAHHSVLITRD